MQFRNNVEFNKNQALNMLLQMIAGNHGSPVEGIIWYDSTGKVIKYHDGTSVITLASGAGISPNLYDAQSVLVAVVDNTPVVQLVGASQIVGRKSTGNVGILTMAELVTELLVVDGAGSLLDADFLDAQSSAYYLARANHSGTQTASTISDLATVVQAYRLDQFAAPNVSLSMGTQKITNVVDPAAAQDAATKNYVDLIAAGIRDLKQSVRAASTAAVTVTYTATAGVSARGQMTAMPDTLDGVTLAANDRVLLKDQAAGAQNGIWVVTTLGTGANGVWDRATDFDADTEVTAGAFSFVTEGTVNGDNGWVLTTNDPIIIGGASGTVLVWAQFSGAGQIVAGLGLAKTGNTLDVNVDGTTIEINADILRIAATAAGNGLGGGGAAALSVNVDGTTIEINADTLRIAATAAGAGLGGGGAAALSVNVDATSMEIVADAIRVAAAAAGAGLGGGGAAALSVNVDSTTIEINADTLRVAATAAGAGLIGGGAVALAVGAGTGIVSNANDVAIDTAVVARKYSTTLATSATSYTITHSLGTEDVIAQFRLAAGTKEALIVDWKPNATNPTTQIDATFAVAPSANEIRVTIIG